MEIRSAKDLIVYQKAYQLAMGVFEVSKGFPPEERYALTGADAPVIAVCLSQLAGGLGQKALRSPLH